MGVVEDDEDSDEDSDEDNKKDGDDVNNTPDSQRQTLRDTDLAPIDVCSGVFLHVFCSEPQDLPPNSHPSTNNNQASIESSWLNTLSEKCSLKGLAVNMWGVASFDTDMIGLSSWFPLVKTTGGKIHRSVLGQVPKDERAVLTERLKRAIIPQVATKCLMKLRCSPQMNVGDSTATGNMKIDDDLPGVYRTASCFTDSTYAFTLEHRLIGGGKSEKEKMTGVVVQIAFQYNTLVEASNADMSMLEEEDKEVAQQIKERNEAMKGTVNGISNVIEGKSTMASSSSSKVVYFAEAVREILGLSSDWSRFKKYEAQKIAKQGTNKATSQAGKNRNKSGNINDNSNDSSNDLDQKGDWLAISRTCHDKKKRLMTVRRLRVITINVNCTSKRLKCIRSIDPPVVVAILVRQMMEELADMLQGEGLRSKVSSSDGYRALLRETRELLQEWAAAHISCTIKISNGSMDKSLIGESIAQTMKNPTQMTMLKLLCGATNLGMAHRSLGWNPDRMIEIASFISSYDAYSIAAVLYPVLLPVSAIGEVDVLRQIPLKRDSMLMNAPSNTNTFLMDTGREVVLYKTLAAGMGNRSNDGSGTGNRSDDGSGNQECTDLDKKQASTQAQSGGASRVGGFLSFLGGQGTSAADAAAKKASSAGIFNKNDDDTVDESTTNDAKRPVASDGKGKGNTGSESKEEGQQRTSNSSDLFMESEYWLPNFIHSKLLRGTIVPRPILSEAGTYSSVYFMVNLTEDGDGCGDENDSTIQSYNTFATKVKALALSHLTGE